MSKKCWQARQDSARRNHSVVGLLAPLALFAATGCSSTLDADVERLRSSLAADANEPTETQEWHRGPDVAAGDSGTARFVQPIQRSFQIDRCMDTVEFLDQFYREPANDGYEAALDHIHGRLTGAGFGSVDGLEVDFLETPRTSPAWTPLSGSLTLKQAGRPDVVLHAFEETADADRCMLPVNSPSCDVEGQIALDLDNLEAGKVLVTEAPLRQVLRRATHRGASAVLSCSLYPFNTDTTGADRHLDAIQYGKVGAGTDLPVFQISQRTYQRLKEAYESDPRARLHGVSEVKFDERPLRTLVARIIGTDRPDEAVTVVSHVQEPGACDNASGAGGLMEGALTLSGLLRKKDLDWPSRTLVFLWGDEFRQSRAWLDQTSRRAIAGISSDMTGQSRELTGAIALLERNPDPGALVTLAPDEHSAWGAGEVEEESLSPNGLNVIARCALIDVGKLEGGWECADHPWEGGSDHDVFIDRGVPAVLFWHFTDFAYHTSLDRLNMVDPTEIRRTTAAILATAMAVADPQPEDLARYLASLEIERAVRTAAAVEAADEDLGKMWETWAREARYDLRELCLGLEDGEGNPEEN